MRSRARAFQRLRLIKVICFVFVFVFVLGLGLQTALHCSFYCSARSGARAFQRLRLIKEEKKLPDRNKPPSGPGSGLYLGQNMGSLGMKNARNF